MRPRWEEGPAELVLVRHGESAGNQASTAAEESGAEVLDLHDRDADVELSDTGRDQARAVRRWVDGLGSDRRPTVAVASPYRRAADTAALALEGLDLRIDHDERLRERDLGVLDGLTGAGIRARHPEEADRRKKLGKFYYQPPCGESWADVALRVRSLLNDLRFGYDGERVWLFTHQAVIMAFRYAIEGIEESDLLDVDRHTPIPNASVTRFVRSGAYLELDSFADTTAVDARDVDVTHEPPHRGRGDHVA